MIARGPRARDGRPRLPLADGYSTAGSAGQRPRGHRAALRLSSTSASAAEASAAALVNRHRPGRRARADSRMCSAAISMPQPGEEACGDALAWRPRDGEPAILVADGLGHGRGRAAASAAAVRLFAGAAGGSAGPAARAHPCGTARHARRGRGGRRIDLGRDARPLRRHRQHRARDHRRRGGEAAWCRTTASSATTCARCRPSTYPSGRDALLVMHTDGLGTRWHARRLPRPAGAAPGLIAAVLYRDQRADATTSACWWRARRRARRRCMLRARPMNHALPILALELRRDHDLVRRAAGRASSPRCSASTAQDQIRIATAVSEIARNALRYAGGGKVEFELRPGARRRLAADVRVRPRPGHRQPRRRARRPLRLGHRHGHRHRRRLPADGLVRHRHRARAGHDGAHAASGCPPAHRAIDAERVDTIAARLAACDDARSTEELQRAERRADRDAVAAARAPGRTDAAGARAGGHQSRRGRPVCRARREGRASCAAPTR